MRYGVTGLFVAGLMGMSTALAAEPLKVVNTTDAAKAEVATKVAALPAETTPKTASTQDADASVSKADADKKPVKTAALSPVVSKPRPAAPTVRAVIDLSSQRMTVTVNGTTKHTWKISSGRAGYHTPRGTFRPKWLSRMHYSRQYDGAPMPYSVFFNRGIATHGTGAVGRLGRPASHGCIRLHTANARAFYNIVRKHGKSRVRIVVKGSTPAAAVPVARRKRLSRTTQRVARRDVVRSGRRASATYGERPWWREASRSQRRVSQPSYTRARRTARRTERRIYRRSTARQLRYVRRPSATRRPVFGRRGGRMVFPGDR